jgi:uncharacterized damage-inducible protein DinB
MKAPLTLKQVLLEEAEKTYKTTDKLFRRIDDSELNWKPATGKNWMTIGQLLMHCANYGCGLAVQGFVKGDWGPLPEEPDEAQHLPKAEDLPYVENVQQAIKILNDDQKLTLDCLREVDEAELLSKTMAAPWGGIEMTLFQHLLMMIAHLAQHKGQLFYYLKLMGKDVDSSDLWGEV